MLMVMKVMSLFVLKPKMRIFSKVSVTITLGFSEFTYLAAIAMVYHNNITSNVDGNIYDN